jgi:hypothetical protein
MGIGQFFKKLGSDTKKFFSKGGAADVGLRKLGNTLTKVGGVGSALAPLAAIAAPELAPALMAGSALAGVAGKTAGGIRKGAMKGGDIVEKTKNIVEATKSGIEAAKPIAESSGINFA